METWNADAPTCEGDTCPGAVTDVGEDKKTALGSALTSPSRENWAGGQYRASTRALSSLGLQGLPSVDPEASHLQVKHTTAILPCITTLLTACCPHTHTLR